MQNFLTDLLRILYIAAKKKITLLNCKCLQSKGKTSRASHVSGHPFPKSQAVRCVCMVCVSSDLQTQPGKAPALGHCVSLLTCTASSCSVRSSHSCSWWNEIPPFPRHSQERCEQFKLTSAAFKGVLTPNVWKWEGLKGGSTALFLATRVSLQDNTLDTGEKEKSFNQQKGGHVTPERWNTQGAGRHYTKNWNTCLNL